MADDKWNKPAAPPPPMFFGKKEKDLVKQVNDEIIERGNLYYEKFSDKLANWKVYSRYENNKVYILKDDNPNNEYLAIRDEWGWAVTCLWE